MRRGDALVIGEHEFLIVKHRSGVVAVKEHLRRFHPERRAVGKIAAIVYRAGNDHEKHEAEQAVFDKLPEAFAVFELYYPMREPDDRKPRAGVYAGPFACRTDACPITFGT